MLQMCIVGDEKPLKEFQKPFPETPNKGLIVKTEFAGVCHSDVNQWHNSIDTGKGNRKFTDNPFYNFPICPGHEISGTVQSLGKDVDKTICKLQIGDRVILYPWIGCDDCCYCTNDERHLCSYRHHGLGIGTPGGYSTHVVVQNSKYALKVPEKVPLDVACMLPCSGLTTFNAVQTLLPSITKVTKQKGFASVLIVGAGGLGLWCVQLARHVLPSTTKIVVADISEKSLEQAKMRGGDDVFLAIGSDEDKLKKEMKSRSLDNGFDGVIDLVANSRTAERSFGVTHRGSHIIFVGLYGGAASFPLIEFVHGVRTVQGSLTGSLQQLVELLELCARHEIIPPPLEKYQLKDAYDVMMKLENRQVTGRCLLKC